MFANSKDPDKMKHTIFSEKILQFFKKKYNLRPLNMYNGLSQVYCIEPEGKNH